MFARGTYLFLFLFGFFSSEAQDRQYKFSQLDTDLGLSHNQVNCFLRDRQGFIWIGTASGLNRFDGYNYRVYKNSVRDSTSLVDNYVRNLFEDPKGRIWVYTYFGTCVYLPDMDRFDRDAAKYHKEFNIPEGLITNVVRDDNGDYWFVHQTQGLFRYSSATKETDHVRNSGELSISSIDIDGKGNVWIIYANGLLEKIDASNGQVVLTVRYFPERYDAEVLDYQVRTDNDNDVWMFTANANRGVYFLNRETHEVQHITTRTSPLRLNNAIVRNIAVDEYGLIWVATDHGGLNIIDKAKQEVRYIENDPGDDKSLSQNSLNTIYRDYENIIWIGTYKKGVNYYHENITKFTLITHRTNDPLSLPYDDINCFAEDSLANIWIGTNGGGLIYYDRSKGTYRRFLKEAGNPNSPGSNVIVSMMLDHEGKLWLGTYYGGLDSYDGKRFVHYVHDADDPQSLSDDSVWEIMEDDRHNIWVGTLAGGLNRLDKNTGKFERFGSANGIYTNYIPALLEDDQGTIWVGSGYGISRKKTDSENFTHVLGNDQPGSLSNNSIVCLYQDSRDYIWIGTQDGLNLYDRSTDSFRVFRIEDGLPHNNILTIVEDDSRNLWASTPAGLTNIVLAQDPGDPEFTPIFKNYDELDGLQGKQFNTKAALKTRKGELLFGGVNGFNLFDPDDITVNDKAPPVALVGLQIFNKEVAVQEQFKGRTVLDRAINQVEDITLTHDQNVFSLEFAALSFFHPEKNRYKYRLKGFTEEWLEADGRNRRVTYTNLDPGTYTFQVIAANSDGVWNDEGTMLTIHILPPFWKTRWAFGIYLVAIVFALLITRQLILQRERLKFKIEKERAEAHRIHELDMVKIKFFTNVSHEFRTPLTLIITPLERLMQQARDAVEREHLQLIHRNARRLLNLVNQLLDFRRMEVQEIKLNPSEGDIVQFVKEVSHSFSDLSEKKNISFAFTSEVDSFETVFDHNKLERIMFNLISNAFKFTQPGGQIEVHLSMEMSDMQEFIRIDVRDTGIGIPAETIDRVFERFFQNDLPGSLVNQGSGIGLSITREFVRIHGGTVTVVSEPEKGSVFTVRLPVMSLSTSNALPPETATEVVADENAIMQRSRKRSTVLLVEDNEDFRFYLKDNLKVRYAVIEAHNGKEGWDLALRQMPDLIVSDVMMPEMNGMELCRKLKEDARTSHIPIILLTARTAQEQKMQGFESGADDYVTKPFNFEILMSRIRNLIESRERFQKAFQGKIEVKASEISVSSLDEKLIGKAIRYVEENISDPDFSVEHLSHELGMSRVHLYKKLTALTGKSPIEFIRAIRLQRAAQLLGKSQLTVAEVAYQVGFNNPKYFAKYFREEFNMLPSVYANTKRDG